MCACKAPKDVVYFEGIDKLTPEQLVEMSQTYTTKISNDDFSKIKDTMKTTRVKLGLIAVSEKLLTEKQSEEINRYRQQWISVSVILLLRKVI